MTEYKDIKGYEGLYLINSHGFIYSPPKGTSNPKGKYMSISNDHNGYPRVVLRKNGTKHNHSVHRLLAETWIENPNNFPQVNHKNGIRHDNRVENLEWCTGSENALHSFRVLKRIPMHGKDHPNSKLTDDIAKSIKKMLEEGVNQYLVATKYGVSQATVSNINRGLIWKHV